jgi:pyruvate,water dikinase
MNVNVLWLTQTGMQQINQVGGKNASLGEMLQNLAQAGIQVPTGVATTAEAYQRFIAQESLAQRIHDALANLDINNVTKLAQTGKMIREWIINTPFLPDFIADVQQYYGMLTEKLAADCSFAVRSSATAEDLPEASFAGQQETFLNVSGLDNILLAIKKVYASLFNDRAITYRAHHGFDHKDVAISAGIQQMVRSDKGTSGVMFSMDTESGFKDVVFITASYGLGEPIVQGQVNPDEFYVYKQALDAKRSAILRRNIGSKKLKMVYAEPGSSEPVKTVNVAREEAARFCLSDAEVEHLARQAVLIEKHYGKPVDIEWAKDGINNEIYILQARPETVKSRDDSQVMERYQLGEHSEIITSGRSIGQKIGQGRAKVLTSLSEMDKLNPGDVLVTDMTDPDWEPIMKRASAIVTNRGGRTCHAAIIARELGIPAVVGTHDATETIKENMEVTISCAEGDTGFVYQGLLKFDIHTVHLTKMPELPFKIMMNVGNPERAFAFQSLPNHGVGLARIEFIISQMIGVHPKALLNFNRLDNELKKKIQEKIEAYADPIEYYVERLKEGIATIAAAFNPKMVIIRLSDFKSNEYANLLGGDLYEPHEENPMLGFRGASRYIAHQFTDCFELECRAINRVRNEVGLTNVAVMIPFVRTVSEAKQVVDLLAQHGLKRGENGLKLIMMCEIPSNALLADEFLQYFDGFSIGSNDLTQLTLGLDRDSGIIANLFDERDAAVKKLLHLAIDACKRNKKYIGICGQGPSDHPDLAKWLMDEGIDTVSLNPDTVVDTWLYLSKNK